MMMLIMNSDLANRMLCRLGESIPFFLLVRSRDWCFHLEQSGLHDFSFPSTQLASACFHTSSSFQHILSLDGQIATVLKSASSHEQPTFHNEQPTFQMLKVRHFCLCPSHCRCRSCWFGAVRTRPCESWKDFNSCAEAVCGQRTSGCSANGSPVVLFWCLALRSRTSK